MSKEIVAVMEAKSGYGVGHINFRLARIGDGDMLEDIRRYDDDGRFAGLSITSQFEADKPDHIYAWRVEYVDAGDVQFESANVMLGVLKVVDKKMKAYHDEWGNCENYSQFVQRALKSLGVKKVVCTSKFSGEPYEYNEFVTWKVSDVPYLVSGVVSHYQTVER